MPFDPLVDQQILIGQISYRFTAHPASPGAPYAQEGRYGAVFQLRTDGPAVGLGATRMPEYYALKVFRQSGQSPTIAKQAKQLERFASLPGLQVCKRRVLIPDQHRDLLKQHPDLSYAALMAWIDGPTWFEMILSKHETTQEESLALALSLVTILGSLEQEGVAHCDLSGSNIIVQGLQRGRSSLPGLVLVDVEQLYGPGLDRPGSLPKSSPGYAHRLSGSEGRWDSLADRFAGAVLLGEMLGWCDADVRDAAWGETYFAEEETQQICGRYQFLQSKLQERWGDAVAYLFRRAWESSTLSDCPTFADWLAALSPVEVKQPLRHWPPRVDDQIEIDGMVYTFTGHPAAPRIPYTQEGRYAIVYQVQAAGMTIGPDGKRQQELCALKVNRRGHWLTHRGPFAWKGELAQPDGGLQEFASLPGLQVCNRTVLSPERYMMVLKQQPDLFNAVLMPWIEGQTWSQVVQTKQPITQGDSVMLARSLAEILNGLSARGAAHCDLSGDNLIVQGLDASTSLPPQVALVDVEQLYAPGLVRPDFLPQGSGGYVHRASGGLWDATADRFAGAVLLAEMMAWCDPITREAAWGDSYFAPDEMHTPCARYELLRRALVERGEWAVANLFERAWQSESLAACPTFQQWLNALPRIVDSGSSKQGVADTTRSTAPGTTGTRKSSVPDNAGDSKQPQKRAQNAVKPAETGVPGAGQSTAPGVKRSCAAMTARMILFILLALIVTGLFFWLVTLLN